MNRSRYWNDTIHAALSPRTLFSYTYFPLTPFRFTHPPPSLSTRSPTPFSSPPRWVTRRRRNFNWKLL